MRKFLLIGLIGLLGLAGCRQEPADVVLMKQQPVIYPDYIGVTVPVDIAPLNFNVIGEGIDRVDAQVTGSKGGELHANGEYADFDIDEWHALTEQNKGGELKVTVCVRKDGKWLQYQDFKIFVSPYALEEWGVTYRRIAPGYEVYSHMGLYQRDLSNFDETTIFDNRRVPAQCLNCHMSNRTDPGRFVFHVRGKHGATMIQTDGKREWLKASNDLLGGSMVYPYWHPSGQYCAFSTNQTRQGFHVVQNERIEVKDLSSDVFVYVPTTHEILTDTLLQTKDWMENSPVFSPDGKTLYYITSKQHSDQTQYKDEKYNLCKIAFDPGKGTFGDHVDTLFNAVSMEKSVTWPRPSYDGKYILFTLIDYGYFSIWHEESEQWLLDLKTGEARPLKEINSPRADSYHNWNVNSHWIVFTSRRDDGLYSRLYFASVDDKGEFTKPFMLPQRHPKNYYDESVYSFNTPDFTKRKVDFNDRAAASEVMSDRRVETKVRQQ